MFLPHDVRNQRLAAVLDVLVAEIAIEALVAVVAIIDYELYENSG